MAQLMRLACIVLALAATAASRQAYNSSHRQQPSILSSSSSSSSMHRQIQAQDSSFSLTSRSSSSNMTSACQAAVQNIPFATNKSINVQFYYEVLTFLEPLQVGFAIEKAVQDHLVKRLVLDHCLDPLSSSSSSTASSFDKSLSSVQGAAVGGSSVLSYCVHLVWDQQENNVECYKMIGSVTVFLDKEVTIDVRATETAILEEIFESFEDGSINPERIYGVQAFETMKEPFFLSPTTVRKTSPKTASASLDTFSLVGIILLVIAGAIFLATGIYVIIGKCKDMEMEEQMEEVLSYRESTGPRRRILSLEGENITIDFASPKKNGSEDTETTEIVNPFTHREGRTLQWRNVNMILKGKGGVPDRKILDNVFGEVPKGETTAIMGGSGTGKTSLLNVLSGRAQSRGKILIECDVRLDNYTVDPRDINVRKSIAFVAQDDSLQITSTPREAIRFSAKLRLPRTTTEQELDELTTQMLTELGLTSCADTIVGGMLQKSISGGERKRTSIGVELVVKPAMVFLDEPTSGLDSYSALQCVRVLKKVAKAGASVMFTIHQPSSDIFASFDQLILLQQGRVLYHGPVESVTDYFDERGYPCPTDYNPADWILTVAQTKGYDELKRKGMFPRNKSDLGAIDDLRPLRKFLGSLKCNGEDFTPVPGFGTQVKLLVARELRNLKRNPTVFTARIFLNLVLSFFLGAIFWKVGETNAAIFSNLQSHFGAITAGAVLMMLASGETALLSFPSERPVFLREYTTSHYSVPSYFVSRLLVEALVTSILSLCLIGLAYSLIGFQGSFGTFYGAHVFLAMICTAIANAIGACAGSDQKLAAESLPAIFTPQILFAGFFVTPALMPAWIQWVQYVFPLTYVIRILLVAEFYQCSVGTDNANNEAEVANCEMLLENTDADPDQVWWYWLILLGQFVVFRTLALWFLKSSAHRFY